MKRVLLVQIDGLAFPNLALMKLAHWHRSRGDTVTLTTDIGRDLITPAYDTVYGSAIFKSSATRLEQFCWQWPDAIVGGTGVEGAAVTVEDVIGGPWDGYDYSLYPNFTPSIGFTQRGCRFDCKFCVVPTKEGRVRVAATVAKIWRGPGYRRKILLLDNDFFGQPAPAWRARVDEIVTGNFTVCLTQGVNLRHLTDEQAAACAAMKLRDSDFRRRRLYTAWDDIDDEAAFFRGADRLRAAGFPLHMVMAYMLVGFDPTETWGTIFHRFEAMRSRRILPFVMIYNRDQAVPELRAFARWVNLGLYRTVAWADFNDPRKAPAAVGQDGSPPSVRISAPSSR